MASNDAAKAPTYDKYMAQEDLRHLTHAEAIKKDPTRMKHVKRAAKEKLAEMAIHKKIAEGGMP